MKKTDEDDDRLFAPGWEKDFEAHWHNKMKWESQERHRSFVTIVPDGQTNTALEFLLSITPEVSR